MQEVEGSTPTGGTCPNDFSDPIDQDIRTQWALSWKIVVSEWRLVIAVSLNVGSGVRLIKPAKLCMCTQNTTNTTRTEHIRTAPGVCSNGSVPLSHSGNVVTRIGIHTHTIYLIILEVYICVPVLVGRNCIKCSLTTNGKSCLLEIFTINLTKRTSVKTCLLCHAECS